MWSEWFGGLIETGQGAVGEWFEDELQDELGLGTEQEDAQKGTSIGLGITSAGRDQLSHEQQTIAGSGGSQNNNLMLLAGLAIAVVVAVKVMK